VQENTFSIYQLKEGDETRDYRYEPYDHLISAGLAVEKENYNLVYTAPLAENDTLGTLFRRFNIDHPDDFIGHSLSISDVVTLHKDGKDTAYYVDSGAGFTELKGFLRPDEIEKAAPKVYKYYSTQRPVDIGTFPKTENGPAKIVNFDKREGVENGRFQAWGYLLYTKPLTEKQISDFELRAAPGNPDQLRLTPEQLEQQVQIVGKWEQAKHIPDGKRLTWWYPDFGVFVKNEFVTDAALAGRYEKIVESKARAAKKSAEKKPIAEQLKEAAKQSERGEMPPAKKKSHNHEDR
jgi:hypothetical protein